ncbi:MAG TPA: hypothetical protein VFC92_08695 [Bacteroidales bacterium]|nr:hypothetical protein [Bacteroidales bacterium]
MIRKIFFSIIMLSQMATALGQVSVGEIQNSGNYLWGIGEGSTHRLADASALDHLITQITVQVESYFQGKLTEQEGSVKEFAESVVKTYSNVSLESALSMVLEERGNYFRVMRYISFDNLNNLFESRRRKIEAYVAAGAMAEKDLRLGDALKNYYWALALLQSHKDRDKITYNFDKKNSLLLLSALPDKMNDIFTDLHFQIRQVEDRCDENYKALHLLITYHGEPVDNLDFEYWCGNHYSNTMSVRSGMGLVEFLDAASCRLDRLKIRVEYAYLPKARYDLEVYQVLNNISIPYIDRSEFVIAIPVDDSKKKKLVKLEAKSIDFEQLNEIEEARKVRKTVMKVIDAIQDKNYAAANHLFTPSGLMMYERLINSGQVKVLPFADTLRLIQIDDNTIVRSVPMRFSYPKNHRDFIEQVVFTLNADQQIDAISFAISDKAIADIASRSDRFGSTEDKYHLISFLEYYKTAYCLKRLDLIAPIFADNALIIVGNVVQMAEPIDGMYARAGRRKVEYITQNKAEYLGRLMQVFNSNEFVNIHFEENIVKKVNGEDKVYGIQIKQDYYSTNYADKGYLFLMIDLSDSLQPKIYVRTWQPERNADGTIYGLSDFVIN